MFAHADLATAKLLSTTGKDSMASFQILEGKLPRVADISRGKESCLLTKFLPFSYFTSYRRIRSSNCHDAFPPLKKSMKMTWSASKIAAVTLGLVIAVALLACLWFLAERQYRAVIRRSVDDLRAEHVVLNQGLHRIGEQLVGLSNQIGVLAEQMVGRPEHLLPKYAVISIRSSSVQSIDNSQ